MHSLTLNPRYINSAFRSQARNLLTAPRKQRESACLLQAISKHIIKHGNDCFASTARLLDLYNQYTSNYSIKAIQKRTLATRLNELESRGLISRSIYFNKATSQSRRFISINLPALKQAFAGVFNYAMKYANAFVKRQELHSGRPSVENNGQARQNKAPSKIEKSKNCTLRSNDQSKDIKIKGRRPSDSFYLKFFKHDADKVKSLQESARQGKISASGAKALIQLHQKWACELHSGFKRFLLSVVLNEKKKAADKAALKEFIKRTNVN